MTENRHPAPPAVEVLIDHFVQLAVGQGFVPSSHITLTYDRKRWRGSGSGPSRRQVEIHWRQLVRRLNQWVGGKRYYRKWGHSYFGYVMGVELHRDGIFHAHAVVDNWIDFRLLHDWWNDRHGFAWIKQVDDDPMAALRYVIKYVVKEDLEPDIFFQKIERTVDVRSGRVFPV